MDILNIRNIDIESKIKEIINNLNITEYDGMCEVYANIISENLNKLGIMNRILKTDDFKANYHHVFVIAFDSSNYYLIDPTYRQFELRGYLYKIKWFPAEILKSKMKDYDKFIEDGVIKVDDELLTQYLYSFNKLDEDYELSNVIMK